MSDDYDDPAFPRHGRTPKSTEAKEVTVPLREPEELGTDAFERAIEELDGAPLPVHSPTGERSAHSIVGWATLSYDRDEKGAKAAIKFVDTDQAKATLALLNAGPAYGFGISGRVVERVGPLITKMKVDQIDFVARRRPPSMREALYALDMRIPKTHDARAAFDVLAKAIANDGSAGCDALDAIVALTGTSTWDYPGQVVRDVEHAIRTRDNELAALRDEVANLRELFGDEALED